MSVLINSLFTIPCNNFYFNLASIKYKHIIERNEAVIWPEGKEVKTSLMYTCSQCLHWPRKTEIVHAYLQSVFVLG